jgi:ABC-type transport system involved in multi-copper enzyme maturation permease subunit
VALAGISVTTALMMVFLSGEALVGEIEKGTINFMLSKPISRLSFLLGRFFGLVLTGAVSIGLGAAMFLIVLHLAGGTLSLGILLGFLYMIMEIAIIASLGVMFSSLSSSSVTATLLCALLYILGHLNPQLGVLASLLKSEGARFAVQAIRLLIPNLEYLNIRHEVVQGAVPGLTSILTTLGYVLLYVSGSIIIAAMVFGRREL